MEVTILRYTENPIEAISLAAGTCYRKDDFSSKRVKDCYERGHLSVFEHASATFRIEGISRACMAQLTRHRLASFCVESQRYNKYDLSGDDWFVTPDIFKDTEHYAELMKSLGGCYMDCLKAGIKPEDARYLLPEATKTNLVMTCNLRELYHFFDMRANGSAQWEIRQLAGKMAEALASADWGWAYLIGLWG